MRTMAAASAALIGLGMGAVASAQQADPFVAQSPVPESRWTPSSEAPSGILAHNLEAQRHDFFIELAQQGDIELVFFGTTEAEMWWWPDRGRGVWDREFGSIDAANFGSQGTHLESLVWRMRNGELDGFEARLIVLQAGLLATSNRTPEGMIAGYRDVLDEIRLRQPQAKVLLFAPLPRGGNVEGWRQQAAEHQARFAELVDDETVFYTDIGERFFNEDGSFKRETWGLDVANRGNQTGGYEIWADAMQPWIDRFVR